MSNLSTFKLTTTGEALRGLINLRIADIERQHNLIATAIAQCKQQIVELNETANTRIAQLQHRAGRVIDSSVGISEISALEDRVVRLEDASSALALLRKQSLWMHDQVVPTERYEMSAHDLAMFGFDRAGIDVVNLVAPRY